MHVPVLWFKMALRQLSPAFMHLCILNVSTIWFIHVLYIWGNCGSKGTKFMYVLHVILSKLWKQGYAVHVYIAYVLVTSKFQNDYDLTSILLSKEWLCIISDIFLFINHKNLLNFVHIKLSRLSSIKKHCFRWLLWRITWPQRILWCQWRYPVGSPRSRTRGSGPALLRRWILPHISRHRGALQPTLSSLLKENNFKESNFRTFTRSQFTIFFPWVNNAFVSICILFLFI